MTSLLTAISGKFNVALVLSTVLPVTIFVIVARIMLPPLFPSTADLPFVEDSEVFSLTLVIVILSGLFHHLNIPQIRMYEGYPWEGSPIGKWCKERFRREMAVLMAKREGLPQLSKWLKTNPPSLAPKDSEKNEKARDRAWSVEGEARRTLQSRFPTRPSSLLPTRLGNVIRSAENYPQRMYGMAAITLWPRLVSKIDPGYATLIEGAKASLDVMLNAATLSFALGMAVLTAGLARPALFLPNQSWLLLLLETLVLFGLARWFYNQSIGRAAAWGNTIRGAFDLYRWGLLEQLGYGRKPRTVEEEKEMWTGISSWMVFLDEPVISYELRLAADSSVTAREDVELSLHRAVRPTSLAGRRTVVLKVRNQDDSQAAANVVLTETVPEGYDFVADSETVDAGTVEISGINPYRFHFSEPIRQGADRVVTYEIERRA